MATFLSLTRITFQGLVHFQRTRNCLFQAKPTLGYMFQNLYVYVVSQNMQNLLSSFLAFVFFVKPVLVIDLQLNPQHYLEAPEKLSSPLRASLCAIW